MSSLTAAGEHGTNQLKTVATKTTQETHQRLRWLAYNRNVTVSVILGGYLERCIAEEDFTGYRPPDPQ